MAHTKPGKSRTVVELPEEEEETTRSVVDEEDAQDELPPDSDLDALLAESGADEGYTVTVYRIVQPGRRLSYLFSCAPHEFSRDALRDVHGGGDFKVFLKKGRAIKTTKVLLVAPPLRPIAPPPPPAPAVSDELRQVLQGIKETVSGLVAAVARPPAESEEAMLRRMMLYKQLFAGNGGGNDDQFEKFFKGIAFAREIGEQGAEKTNIDVLVKAIETFGKPLATLVTRAAATQQTAAPRAPAAPGGAPKLPGVTTETGATEGMNPLIKKALQQKIAWLCEQAKVGADVSLYGDLILDQVPPDTLSQFLEGDSWQKLLAMYPPAVNYEPWFRELLSHVTAALSEDGGHDVPGDSLQHTNEDVS